VFVLAVEACQTRPLKRVAVTYERKTKHVQNPGVLSDKHHFTLKKVRNYDNRVMMMENAE